MFDCADPDCKEQVAAHRWGAIKAQEAGWFFRKDGNKAWCPNHTPEWVAYWRARKAGKKA